MSPFVEQWDAPIDCFIKCPVFCRAPLPLPLLEIDEREFVGGGGRGGTCMLSSPTRTNGSLQVRLQLCPIRKEQRATCWRMFAESASSLHHSFFFPLQGRTWGSDLHLPRPSRCPLMAGINHGCSRGNKQTRHQDLHQEHT